MQSTVLEVALVKLPDDGLEVSVLYCQLTVVPSAWAGVLYVSGVPAATDSPSLRSVQLDPPLVEYWTSKYIVEFVAVKVIVDVALPLEHDPSPVATVPVGQSEVLMVTVLTVLVPELGDL